MEEKKESYFVTTPIYYVNADPHIGHAYTTLAADVLARYNRLAGKNVFFLTGTDEHGQKVQEAAKKRGVEPIDHCNEMVIPFQNLWKKFHFSHNDFIRTTEERHKKVVQTVIQDLYDKDEIYKDTYDGWYCMFEERFWTEKELAEGKCPECHRSVTKISESNYFFRMGKYQDWLIDHINSHEDFIQPKTRRNEILGFLNKKLEDLCISRPKERLSWGIPLPFDENYVTYVWFDALLNYVSASGYLSDPERFRSLWSESIHLIGKDILTTHSVYWPTMLKAIGLTPPKTIFAHGWWTMEGRKMSKSLGNVVEPNNLVDTYGVDQVRYFLLREVPFGLDGDYSHTAMVNRINSDLANDLGNLLSRSLTMIKKYFDGIIPAAPARQEEDDKLIRKSESMIGEVGTFLNIFNFQKALISIWGFVSEVNKYIDDSAPWNLAKEKNTERLSTVMYNTAESIRILAIILSPFMPETSQKIWEQLGIKEAMEGKGLHDLKWGGLEIKTAVCIGKQLFPRIEEKTKEAKTGKKVTEKEMESHATIEDLAKLNLRAGRIVHAEKVEKSKKLLKLQVDLGEETRTVVAGIAEHYSPDEIIGKNIILVANLKPATIMGIESQGMVLAGNTDGKIILSTFDKEVDPGSTVR